MKRYALHIAVPDDVPLGMVLDVMASQMASVTAAAYNGRFGKELKVDEPVSCAVPDSNWDAAFLRYE